MTTFVPHSRALDLTGQKFGHLTYLRPVGPSKSGSILWLCQCDCGKQTEIVSSSRRKITTCGCKLDGRLYEYKKTGFFNCKIHGKTSEVTIKDDRYFTCKLCQNAVRRVRKSEQKQRAITFAGGCCQLCGYDTYNGALEFHHLDPSEKDFQVNQRLRSWENIKKEIGKCILLCANCHREVHAGLRSVNDVRNDE